MEYWKKMLSLIETVKSGERQDIQETLSSGRPSEVMRVLQSADISMEDLAQIYEDLEDVLGLVAARWVPYSMGHEMEDFFE